MAQRLFYGKGKWSGAPGLMGALDDAEESTQMPVPNLFKRKPPMPQQPMDDDIAEPMALPDQSPPSEVLADVPNYQKRAAEDSPLAGRLFSHGGRTQALKAQGDPEMPQGQEAPKLFKGASSSPQLDELGLEIPQKKKTGFFSNILKSIGDQILPGFASRASGDTEAYDSALKLYKERRADLEPPADIKTFNRYSEMTPQKQAAFREMKSASSMNPLAISKFGWQQDEAAEKKVRRDDELKDKYVEKLQGKLGNSQDAVNTLGEVSKVLGFNPEDYDPNTEMVDGKTVDIPGVSIPGLGRTSFYNKDARTLSNTAQKLFNLDLKDRSGAVITTNEMERIKDEYSKGKYNDEAELMGAMGRYSRALREKMKNIEAGYSPDVVGEYQERGGTTSKRLERERISGTPQFSPAEIAAEKARRGLK